MADYTSDRTGANIDTVLDNADEGNIGKDALSIITTDINLETSSGFYRVSDTAPNSPIARFGSLVVCSASSTVTTQMFIAQTGATGDDKIYFRRKLSTWQAWQELYHTGNTGLLNFSDSAVGYDGVNIGVTGGLVAVGNSGVTLANALYFTNANGAVGNIQTSGTTTAYNTSSDPRLKDFKAAPTDAEVNAKFDDLFGCFKTFNWKNDPTGDLVWGFDAHATIDAGLDMGSEGEGSRDLALGDVYKTDEAELDEDGVEIKAAIEHKVSPAGVDQSKAVPILLAKIEQLERRLKALEV